MKNNSEKTVALLVAEAVAEKPPSHPPLKQRLKKIFQTKKSLLTVFGAAIILSTYSIKEVGRESLKGDIDSIDTAVNLLLVHQDNEEIAYRVEDLQKTLAKGDKPENIEGTLVYGESIYLVESHRYKRAMTFNSAFLNSLPEVKKRTKSKIEVLEKDIVMQMDNYSSRTAMTLSRLSDEQLKSGSIPSVSTKELDQMIEESEEIQRIVIEEAEAIKIRKQFWFTIAGIAAYSLYAVGIILGLIGGLLGEEIAVVGD